jgi:hypothetical protein
VGNEVEHGDDDLDFPSDNDHVFGQCHKAPPDLPPDCPTLAQPICTPSALSYIRVFKVTPTLKLSGHYYGKSMLKSESALLDL